MTVIEKHPKREQIERILKKDTSYKDKALEIENKFGLSLAPKTLEYHHLNRLGGFVLDSEGVEFGEPEQTTPLDIDLDSINKLLESFKSGNTGEALRECNLELYCMQFFILKDALNKYIGGQIRYPSEIVRNFQILAQLAQK
jgi:hypothetical protein